jgi:hypothetical protein
LARPQERAGETETSHIIGGIHGRHETGHAVARGRGGWRRRIGGSGSDRCDACARRNPKALKAAGDLVFNGGVGAYRGSAIAISFGTRQWAAGCNAFPGWWAAATFSKPQPRYACRPKKGARGKFLCNLPGVEKRRIKEQVICLGKAAESHD